MLQTNLPICESYLAEKTFAYSDIYDTNDYNTSRDAQVKWLVKVVSRRGSMTLEEARAALLNTAKTWADQVFSSNDSTDDQITAAVNAEGNHDTREDTEVFGDIITTAIKTTDMIITADSEGELCLQMSD